MSQRISLPPFPDGWFCVGESHALARGQLAPIHYFGRDLVLMRGQDGLARVFGAHCPHLGAHLGFGGSVEGNGLRCPFHGWRFDGHGRCAEVPYARRLPKKAALETLPACEKNGAIMVWHHGAGAAPQWELPDVPEWGSPEWTEPVRRTYRVRTHPQEMAENVVDAAHFQFVHGTPHPPPTKAGFEGHVFRVESGLTFTTPRGEVPGKVTIETHGFGFGITRFTGVVETLLIVTGGPVDEELCETTVRFTVKRLGDDEAERNVARAFVAEIDRQYTQDIPIWEHKVHLPRPMLCDGDGPIALLRRWGRQFYSGAGHSGGRPAAA